jgi:hypothetical protein
MTADRDSKNFTNDRGFLSSVVEIEMECWENDIPGTKGVLLKLGCTAAQAEAAIGSYLCRLFPGKEVSQQV